MRRICLCLLIAVASASVGAREVKLSSPDGGSCPESLATRGAVRKPAPVRPVGARDARARPAVHSDVGAAPRTRWHSFLPGMFR